MTKNKLEWQDFIKSKKTEELEAKQHDAEQYLRKFNRKIHRAPESEEELDGLIVLNLG